MDGGLSGGLYLQLRHSQNFKEMRFLISLMQPIVHKMYAWHKYMKDLYMYGVVTINDLKKRNLKMTV